MDAVFVRTHRDEQLVYYRCDIETWETSEARKPKPIQTDAAPSPVL